MTDFTRDYGVYSSGTSVNETGDAKITPTADAFFEKNYGMADRLFTKVKPGICIPWDEKLKELPNIPGDSDLVRRIWEDIDSLGNMFIWQCLLSF